MRINAFFLESNPSDTPKAPSTKNGRRQEKKEFVNFGEFNIRPRSFDDLFGGGGGGFAGYDDEMQDMQGMQLTENNLGGVNLQNNNGMDSLSSLLGSNSLGELGSQDTISSFMGGNGKLYLHMNLVLSFVISG